MPSQVATSRFKRTGPVSRSGHQLFQLIGNRGQVMIFDIGNNHTLTPRQIVSGLPELGNYGLLVL